MVIGIEDDLYDPRYAEVRLICGHFRRVRKRRTEESYPTTYCCQECRQRDQDARQWVKEQDRKK
jgi:hypothetical protein